MKKLMILGLAVLLVMSLAACGAQESGQSTTGAPDVKDTTAAPGDTNTSVTEEDTTPEDPTEQTAPKKDDEVFFFEADGVKIIPGTPFDPTGLPEVEPYTVPSCAFDGSDVIYTYDAFEVTTYDDSNDGIVYSIYFLDPNLTTPEGLALGDDASRVTELYGDDCEVVGDQVTYQKGDTLLLIILQNDTVFSIEYRLAM